MEKMKTLLNALLFNFVCFISQGISQIEKLEPDFRNSYWGDSMDTVKKNETAKSLFPTKDRLTFDTKILNIPFFIFYVFEDDKLFRSNYSGKQVYVETEYYIDDFNKVAELLREKYGEENNKTYWVDTFAQSRYENPNLRQIAMCINLGYLVYYYEWETIDTVIALQLFKSKDFSEIVFTIHYDSKEFKFLSEQKKDREKNKELKNF